MASVRARHMVELRRQGWSTQTIAREHGISAGRVAQLVRIGTQALTEEQQALDAQATSSGNDLAVEHAGLGTRATNAMRNEGLFTLGDVADEMAYLRRATPPNLGNKSMQLVDTRLKHFGVAIPTLALSGRAVDVLGWNGMKRTSQIVAAFGPGGADALGEAALSWKRMTPDLLAEIRRAVAEFVLPSRVISGSPYEAAIGFSRAIRKGERIFVSGTAPVEPDGTTTPGNAAAQAERVFAIIAGAIETLGGSMADVVRTRMYVVAAEDADAVGAVHARWLGAARPAATMVIVAGLLRPEWRVEAEAEAVLGQ